ncbi:MAG: hypothetical protein E6J89_08525 [Deltaproteobacteria bacterium]|nr:MAG: hypothetical protein E6J89_08525 [Deltaproteobacteria bacterium]
MKIATSFLSALLVVGALGMSGTPATADVLSRVELDPGTDYCHMQFPAIREDTLNSDRPVLKDASTGDIVDYYGSCDHDPLGKDEIAAQRAGSKEWRRVHEGGE